MQAILDINTNAVVQHTHRLEQISRSALPVAVRQTLNKAAFDVKTNTMPKESDRFIHRKPTFFKANSRVEMAKGFDVNSMQSIVGFVPKPNDASHSVEDLEQQENSGDINNRAFIALPGARVSGSWNRNVQVKHRLKNVRSKLVSASHAAARVVRKTGRKRKGKERYIVSAVHAKKDGYIKGNFVNSKGNKTVEFIRNLKRVSKIITDSKGRTRKRKDTVVVTTAVYNVKASRKIKPHATHFMEKASMESARKMEQIFTAIATQKINSIP